MLLQIMKLHQVHLLAIQEYLDEVPFLLKAFETAYYDLENYDILSDDQ